MCHRHGGVCPFVNISIFLNNFQNFLLSPNVGGKNLAVENPVSEKIEST